MAARYVNPDNVTAQGQYFYTGLLPGSYDSQGGRAGNVYGAGSGGSAGVSPDYTGADAGKSWQYPASFDLKLPVWDKGDGMGDGGGTQGPPGTPNPVPNPQVSPGRRKAKLPQQWHKVTMKPSNTEAAKRKREERRVAGRKKTVNARLGESILEANRVRTPALGGEGGTREFAELPQAVVNAGTEFPMESGGSVRTDLEFMRHPKPAAVAASNAGSQGMWGETTEGPVTDCGLMGCAPWSPKSPSRSQSRPPTF